MCPPDLCIRAHCVLYVPYVSSQDVLAIKKTGKSNIVFQLVHPTKRHLEDLELDFDFSDGKVRDEVLKVGAGVRAS